MKIEKQIASFELPYYSAKIYKMNNGKYVLIIISDNEEILHETYDFLQEAIDVYVREIV